MKGFSGTGWAITAALGLAACGGGDGNTTRPPPPPTTFNLQAGVGNMLAHGLSVNVTLSGTVNVNGTSQPFTGTGAYSRSPGSSTTFNGTAAVSQVEAISGTVSAAGQSQPYSTSVTDFYAPGNSAFVGEVDSNEYDVAQAPFVFPTSIVGGSSGVLGTVSRYTDKTMSVPIGTAQLSYSTLSPVDPGSPAAVTLTDKIYDSKNTLIETDTTQYSLDSNNVLSFISASTQTPSGSLTINAH
jgi:hypothetical protein